MYDRVLFPTDGSEASVVATEHALELAGRFDVPVHVVYAVDTAAVQATDAYSGSNYEATVEALEAEGRRRIEDVEDRAQAAGIDVTSTITQGRPASEIVEAAEDGDVIVMGTHGRTGLDRYLIGSTTEKVVRTAEVPVVTVPTTAGNDADER